MQVYCVLNDIISELETIKVIDVDNENKKCVNINQTKNH